MAPPEGVMEMRRSLYFCNNGGGAVADAQKIWTAPLKNI